MLTNCEVSTASCFRGKPSKSRSLPEDVPPMLLAQGDEVIE
jgi:hypothetical protein